MRVETGVTRDAESDYVVSFKVETRTSGLNRKLSVLTDFEAKSNNLRVETGVFRDAESNDVVSFKVQTRTSGFDRKLSAFIDFKVISTEREFPGLTL